MDAENPWQVESIEAFYFLKCPECLFFVQEDSKFHNHAIKNHPLSIVLFGKPRVEMIKEEKSLNLPEKIELLENSFEVKYNEGSFEMEHKEN